MADARARPGAADEPGRPAALLRPAGWVPWSTMAAAAGASGSAGCDLRPDRTVPRSLAELAELAGGVVCATCRPAGSAAPARETLALLGALLAGDWGTADGSEERHRREGSGLVAAYLQWHLERGLRSLRLVER